MQWDAGTGTFVDLVGNSIDSLALTYTVSSSVVAGTLYQFRVRAKNYWGWGPYSTAVSIKASSAPDQMSEVTTTIDPATGGLKIAWSSAVSNSESITAYKIEILDVTDTTWS